MAKRVETKEVIVKYKADTSDFTKALKSLDKSAAQSARSLKNMERGFNTLFRALRNVTVLYYMGRNLIDLGKAFVDAADSMKFFELQAQSLSGSAQGFNDVFLAAQDARIGLRDMMKQVNIFTPALKKLGVSFKGSLGFIQDLTKSMRLYGVQGEAARNSTIQLAQAFSSGRLQGDELRSISENAGGLYAKLEDIIQAMLNTETGLRDLGTEGVLSAEVMFEAFQKLFKELRGGFEELPKTVAQTTSTLTNELILLASTIDEEFNISDTVISSLEILRDLSKELRHSMDDFRGTSYEEALEVQRQKSEELIEAQNALGRAYLDFNTATEDASNALETFSVDTAEAAVKILYYKDKIVDLEATLEDLKAITKTTGGALSDAGQFADAAGDAMVRAARGTDVLTSALSDLEIKAADAASELAALRAGGLAALAVQRQFNEESRFLDTGEDPDKAALKTGVDRIKKQTADEEAALKAIERTQARARVAARSGGGGGRKRAGGGGGGGASTVNRELEENTRRLQTLQDQADPAGKVIREFTANMAFLGGQLGVNSEEFKEISTVLTDDYLEAIDKIQAKDLPKTLEDQVNVMGELYDIMAKDLSGSFIDLAYGTKSWADSILDLESSLLKAITQLLVIKPLMAAIEGGLSSAFPGLGIGTTAARAIGGPVVGGQAYMVGESGPEMFIPRSSGKIEPNGVAKSEVNVAVNFNGSVTGEGLRQSAAQIGAQVAAQTQRALARNS